MENKIDSQLRKGIIEQCVLLILLKKESYSSEIIQTLKDANLLVVEGTLYPLLNRLKREGLVKYRWEESPLGPPRKHYSVTKSGQKEIMRFKKSWKELNKVVNFLSK